ncbi:MAG: hypothetical protein H6739_06430 [Alphaproteobacteria bacterium]|nr:hypothetical protein [Alphaproteobacteria bacterium]MCB9759458.1 hypothetical protein [Alphaproteobacteria bacterium]
MSRRRYQYGQSPINVNITIEALGSDRVACDLNPGDDLYREDVLEDKE